MFCLNRPATHRFKPIVLGFSIAFIAILGSSGCSRSGPTSTAPVEIRVSAVEAIQLETIDYDEFVGQTEATETVDVRSRVSGFIQSIDFVDGSYVQTGDLLFRIEPDSYEAIHQQSLSRIELWKAKLELAQSKLARAKSLFDSRAISDEEYDEAVAAVKEAEASIIAAQADAKRTALDLKYTEVRAEIDGRIDRAFVTPGNMVTGGLGSGTLLTRIVKNKPIYAYVDVDERSLLRYLRLYTSQSEQNEDRTSKSLSDQNIPCSLKLADEEDFNHQGKLDFIENRVDRETGTIRVRGIFDNGDSLLTGGLFIRLRIPVSNPYQSVLVPEQAIGTDQGSKFIYVLDENGIPERRTVKLGQQKRSWRIISEGLQHGEKVVYRGMQRIRPQTPVVADLDSGPPMPESTVTPNTQTN